jgi:hypothetical protein
VTDTVGPPVAAAAGAWVAAGALVGLAVAAVGAGAVVGWAAGAVVAAGADGAAAGLHASSNAAEENAPTTPAAEVIS